MHSMSQRAIAEMFGTAALVLVGPGSVIATLTLAGKAVPAVTEADLLAISFAFGFIITALVYAIGKVSGCHINPAVTFALAVTKRFPWKEVPIYWGAQYVGAIIGAFAIWGVFGQNAVTFGIVDSRSAGGPLAGVVIGGAVVGIILVFGPVTGASLNPARAFGPELVQAIAGGTTFWTQYVPVYLVSGFVGAAAAAFLYDYLANPRLVERPIVAAVSHDDTARAAAG